VPHDIFMLAYGEPNAGENWARLRATVPKHLPAPHLVEGVSGLLAAHAACAARATAPWFFVVDADNWMLDGFDFHVPFEPADDEIATWGATNPFNHLYYGHGGIKLVPVRLFRSPIEQMQSLDWSMSLAPRQRFVDVKASEHRFNTGARATWSTVFRECAKLAVLAAESRGARRSVVRSWLAAWRRPRPAAAHAEWCRLGAVEGEAYAQGRRSDPERLARINDYRWMRLAFDRTHGARARPRAKPAPRRSPGLEHDVFMIAYGEPNAAENWARLKAVVPRARLIENVPGLFAGYAACAGAARTPHYFAVDADNWIRDGFGFEVEFEPKPDEIALWYAANPVNGLEYGHGAIKLLPTALMAGAAAGRVDPIDFSTRLARNRYTEVCASEHRFNGDAYFAWAGAFRECAKLVLGTRQSDLQARELAQFRLDAWCNRAIEGARFADWCIKGAREGRAYGEAHAEDEAGLGKINDYAWMRARFRERHVRRIAIPSRS
jgi:hypothetical protein